MANKLTTKEFIYKANRVHGSKFNYQKTSYVSYFEKLLLCCNKCNKQFLQTPSDHLNGCGCPNCSRTKKKTKQEFIFIAKSKFGNKFNYDDLTFTNMRQKVKIKCNNCGDIFKTSPKVHLRKDGGCSKCAGCKKDTTESFISKCKKIHGDLYDYSNVNYSTSQKKVQIICNKCKIPFYPKANNHLNGSGCPNCIASRNEQKMIKWFIDNKIMYNHQHSFNDCRNKQTNYLLKFDFYLPAYNTCIQYDGSQHFQKRYFSSIDSQNEKAFIKTKNNDLIKNEYCLLNKIKLIRISYKQNSIKQLQRWKFDNSVKVDN